MDASTNISPEESYCQAEKSSSDKNKDNFTFCYYDQEHLGNIRQVTEDDGSKKGEVIQTMNYYPFGAEFCDNSTKNYTQKHKYNGKEFDNMHGLNSYDYGARQYNPVTARWDRIDPLAEKYYSTSPYVYCMNNPVRYIDPDGKQLIIWYGPKDNVKSFTFSGFHGKKSISIPNDPFVKAVIQAYLYNCKNGGGDQLKRAVSRKEKIYIEDARIYNEGENEFSLQGHQNTIDWNPDCGIITSEGGFQSAATILEHEADHANDNVDNSQKHRDRQNAPDPQYKNEEERRVITESETKTAKCNGEAVRSDHKGTPYRTCSPTSTKPFGTGT